jgi:hypothetical protein
MNWADLSLPNLIGMLVGFVFTLFVFSYILGDNVLFRLAIHVFIGVAAGYTAVMVWYNVIWPQLILPILNGGGTERLVALIPLVLSLLLLTKLSPRLSGAGTPVMAYLVGVGAAAAIGGALMGTIFPQLSASINLFDLQAAQQSGEKIGLQLANGSIFLMGMLATLIYFHFGTLPFQGRLLQRAPWIEGISWIGQIFIAITFGTLFAGVYAAALTALIERWYFLTKFLLP